MVVGKEGFSDVTNSKMLIPHHPEFEDPDPHLLLTTRIYNRIGKSSFLIEAIGFGDEDNNYRISMTSSIFFFY